MSFPNWDEFCSLIALHTEIVAKPFISSSPPAQIQKSAEKYLHEIQY